MPPCGRTRGSAPTGRAGYYEFFQSLRFVRSALPLIRAIASLKKAPLKGRAMNSFSRSAWDSALRLSTYGAQEKRPCGSSDELSIINYQLQSIADPAPSPAPAWVGNLVMSSISFYLLLSPSTFFYLIADPAPAWVGNQRSLTEGKNNWVGRETSTTSRTLRVASGVLWGGSSILSLPSPCCCGRRYPSSPDVYESDSSRWCLSFHLNTGTVLFRLCQ